MPKNVMSIDHLADGLSNGNKVLLNKVETGTHTLKIILKDVLFVPKLTCNSILIY